MGTSLRLASSLSFLGIAMLAARVVLTHSLGMTFLAWNLGLAWTAFYLVVLTARLIEDRWVVSALGVGLAAWLFFPNTIYLVSDLAHANYGRGVMRWCDTAMVGTFGLAGAMLALTCLETVRRFTRERLGEWRSWLFCAAIWLSAGVGVWLGRVRRWNSWDAVLDPTGVVTDTCHHFAHPMREPGAWATTLVFAALLAALQIGVAFGRPMEKSSAPT